MITYHGLLSLAQGGGNGFSGSIVRWWEFRKDVNDALDRQLGGHEGMHLVDLTAPPEATDISPGETLGNSPVTSGHPNWTVYTSIFTPAEILDGSSLGLFETVFSAVSNITSLTLAAVQFRYLETNEVSFFTGATSATTVFHGWLTANQLASKPILQTPTGFDELNFATAEPDIVFNTTIYSPGLPIVKFDDWDHTDFQINWLTVPGGGSLVSTLVNLR